MKKPVWHSTTVVCVRHNGRVAMASDGQVTLGTTVMKQTAAKIRRLKGGDVIAGFAGSSADAFALFSRFEARLEEHRGNLERAAIELAKDWRTDKMLRQLEALLIVADRTTSLLLSGTGDLISPDEGLLAVGSGLASRSWWLVLFGLLLMVEVPLLIAVQVRRFRRNYAANQGLHRVITFSPDGIVSQGLVAVSFGWEYFTAWSLRRNALIFVRQVDRRRRLHFLVVPIDAVPDDEWQQLTTTLFERLGPPRKPDSVRRPSLTHSQG